MIQDIELEQAAWIDHPVDASIAGPGQPIIAPIKSGHLRDVPGVDGILFYIYGVKGAIMESSLDRPLLANAGRVDFSYAFTVDRNFATIARLHESDLILVDAAKYKYNGSTQIIRTAAGWKHQLTNAAGQHVDTGILLPPIRPEERHQFKTEYAFDTIKKTISILTFSFDGAVSKIPTALQNMPAVLSNWQASIAHIQQQMCIEISGAYSVLLDDVALGYPD